jgi:hypothetical protein
MSALAVVLGALAGLVVLGQKLADKRVAGAAGKITAVLELLSLPIRQHSTPPTCS